MHISSFTAAIPVNYTSDFLELFEATMYILDADNWYYQIIIQYRYEHSKTAYWANTP
jgi:ribosome biogenesis protein Tsr3